MKSEKIALKRILVVDDDPDVRKSLALLLGTLPAEIECVADGKTALARIREGLSKRNYFDLLILDLSVPRETGEIDDPDFAVRVLRFKSILQLLPVEVPIIVISWYFNTERVVRCMKAGATDVISKRKESQEDKPNQILFNRCRALLSEDSRPSEISKWIQSNTTDLRRFAGKYVCIAPKELAASVQIDSVASATIGEKLVIANDSFETLRDIVLFDDILPWSDFDIARVSVEGGEA